MNKTTNFDLLIVYSEELANSASMKSEEINAPFPKDGNKQNYNLVYAYFLNTCRRNNLKAAFTTSADIIGPGKCRSYWLYEKNNWIKVQNEGFSKLIFAKFSPSDKNRKEKRSLLFYSKKIKPFNNQNLFSLCFDKQETYEKLKTFSIPTAAINGLTKQSILLAKKLLNEQIEKQKNNCDFSDEIVMKDRFGAGGLNVYKFGNNQIKEMITLMKKHKNISFVIQPFVKFDKGFKFQNSSNPTDIRLIFLGQKMIQTYIRIAKKGEFRCNEHAGGMLRYLSSKDISSEIKNISKKIVSKLNNKSSLYALDFIISNNGNIYLLEANTGPGLDWNLSVKENEMESKKLMRIIIKEMKKRVVSSKNNFRRARIVIPVVDVPLIDGFEDSQNVLIMNQTI